MADQSQGIPPGYWEMLKQKAAQLVQMPIQAGQRAMSGMAQAMPTDPNMRPGIPQEALPASVDPNDPEFQRRQAVARAMMMQGGGGGQPMPQQLPGQ